jgi:hypothetical protein
MAVFFERLGPTAVYVLCDLQSLLHARDLYVLDGLYCPPRTQSSQGYGQVFDRVVVLECITGSLARTTKRLVSIKCP